MARIGLLGGTFNPPHIGHLVCAEAAREQLGLDRVVLVPTGVPPHKEVPDDPGAHVRLALARAAVASVPGLEVSDADVRRDGPSFTVDLLRELRAAAPGHELTFLVGGDMAFSLRGWREPEAILELARLAVVEREQHRREVILEALAGMAGVPERLDFVDMPRLDVSSSLLRRRVGEGRSIRWLVPEAVSGYIAEHALYRGGGTA